MEPVDLPLVNAKEPGLVFLPFPGFDRHAFQGIQFEVFERQGILNVYCYESGYYEETECEGIVFPVDLSGNDPKIVRELETLQIVDPEEIQPDEVGEGNYELIQEQYKSFTVE